MAREGDELTGAQPQGGGQGRIWGKGLGSAGGDHAGQRGGQGLAQGGARLGQGWAQTQALNDFVRC